MQQARFGLQLLDLLLVPALVLVALLLDRLPVVLERLARVLVLFLDRQAVFLVFRQAVLEVGLLLLRRAAADSLGPNRW